MQGPVDFRILFQLDFDLLVAVEVAARLDDELPPRSHADDGAAGDVDDFGSYNFV